MSKCDRRYSRSFLGPMPKRILDSLKENYRKQDILDDEGNSNAASRLVMMHAFSFFIHEGGRTEDWNEHVQKQTKKQMMRRWRESGWGKVLVDTGDERETTDQWIGHSFEIGRFLGLDIINQSSHLANGAVSGTQDQVSLSDGAPPEAGPSSGGVNDLRELALSSEIATTPPGASVRVTQHALEHLSPVVPSDTRGQESGANISVSNTPLLVSTASEDSILRDRMLVRAIYSETSLAAQHFNEEYHRTARDLEYRAWGEYLVVLRKDRIELYEDYSFAVREWLSQQKKLAFVIPLSITRTHLSLYSFVDLTFCLTYTPRVPHDDNVTSRWIPFVSRGSKIFIFKVKSRSRAYDWVWKLWLRFNGKLPRSLDVKSPGLNATVTIDSAPETCSNEVEKIYEIFNRENLIKLCVEGLSALSDWSSLIQRELTHGKRLELAWRLDANLDWIWLATDVNQEERKWAVLCGLVAKESLKSTSLEIRLAEHYPNYIHLRNGDRIDEPPGMEGYLQQLRPQSLAKHRVYLSTHDGNLFVLSLQNAYPPPPPGFLPHGPSHNLPDGKSARQTEIWRGALQIMHATGVCDLRNIIAVRRAFQTIPPHTHNEREVGDDSLNIWSLEEPTAEDNQDEGGGDRNVDLSTRRSFELLLKNGHVVRFEAHSSKLALDWINRLRSLLSYWKARHRFDAQQEMELAQATRPRLTIPRREDNHAPLKLPVPLPALVTMHTTSNWCMLEGCRSIVRSGKLFTRKGLRGQYRLVHMFLVANHLVQYRIHSNSLLHPVFRRICLSDAYISCGYLAALMLPEREFDPSRSPAGRRYQDGLETDDKDEDVIFMIRYRPRSKPARDTLYHTDMTTDIPPLSSKQKTLIFRTRSKLERDGWCWAINCEIERSTRMQQDRENAIRNKGNVIPS